MFFAGVGTAAPSTRYTQRECYDALERSPQFAKLDRRGRALLQRVLLRDNGIDGRALAVDPLSDVFDARPDVLHARFAEHAPKLATEAARNALRDACLAPREIDGVIISTCTGYLCPGLTSYVIERLGLRDDVVALDLVGQGCGAALPNLRTAEAYVASGRCTNVLSVCVEVCSAAFFIDDDPGVLVSACLFGDGAGAAVLTSDVAARSTATTHSRGARLVQWIASSSQTDPTHRDTLRFHTRDGMLRNILKPEVPALAAEYAERTLDQALRANALTRESIGTWIWHAGGPKVLESLERRMEFTRDELGWSAGVLREYGNLSSACVYFVLDAALRDGAPPGWWWMSSFGAGFTCHGALLKVSGQR